MASISKDSTFDNHDERYSPLRVRLEAVQHILDEYREEGESHQTSKTDALGARTSLSHVSNRNFIGIANISWGGLSTNSSIASSLPGFLSDLAVSISKACSILWIARQKCDVPKTYYNAYEYLESIDGFFLSLAHAGVLLLVGELGILFWGQPGERQQVRNFWFIVNQSSHALGWIMALGVVGIQISISVMKQYYVLGLPGAEDVRLVSQDLATDGMIKILLFFVGLLLCLPFQSVVRTLSFSFITELNSND